MAATLIRNELSSGLTVVDLISCVVRTYKDRLVFILVNNAGLWMH